MSSPPVLPAALTPPRPTPAGLPGGSLFVKPSCSACRHNTTTPPTRRATQGSLFGRMSSPP
eukprot:275443-Chlamydomonas_euryale.AAC.1